MWATHSILLLSVREQAGDGSLRDNLIYPSAIRSVTSSDSEVDVASDIGRIALVADAARAFVRQL